MCELRSVVRANIVNRKKKYYLSVQYALFSSITIPKKKKKVNVYHEIVMSILHSFY